MLQIIYFYASNFCFQSKCFSLCNHIIRINIIQLLTGFEDNGSFVWPENGSVARSRCCPRSQSITVLLYTFIFSKFSYSLFPLTYPLDVFNILVLQVRVSGRRLDIVTIYHVTYWTKEYKVIGQQFNRSMNCWQVNRTVLQLIGILLLTVKILCIYCIAFIQEKKCWCVTIYVNAFMIVLIHLWFFIYKI